MTASVKHLIPKRRVDKRLWADVQLKASGDVSRKVQAVKLLFRRHYDLPEKSKELLLRLADRSQPDAVRIAIAKELSETKHLPGGLYFGLLKVLSRDTNPRVRAAIDVVQKNIQETIKPVLESIQATTRAQQRIMRNVVASIRFPQETLLRTLREVQLAPVRLIGAQIAASSVLEPLHRIRLTNEEAIRAMHTIVTGYYRLPDLRVVNQPPNIPEKTDGADLGRKLLDCGSGHDFWKDYQQLCRKILTYALVPPLLEPMEESGTEKGRQRRDLIFHIPHDVGGLWESIRINHKSIAMIVECKNHSEPLRSNQLTVASKYFGEKRLGAFGIIACRKGLSESAKDEQKRLWIYEDKMILCFEDSDLLKMLELRAAEDDPAKVIDNAIRRFRGSL
jgi:hypothetical protein